MKFLLQASLLHNAYRSTQSTSNLGSPTSRSVWNPSLHYPDHLSSKLSLFWGIKKAIALYIHFFPSPQRTLSPRWSQTSLTFKRCPAFSVYTSWLPFQPSFSLSCWAYTAITLTNDARFPNDQGLNRRQDIFRAPPTSPRGESAFRKGWDFHTL